MGERKTRRTTEGGENEGRSQSKKAGRRQPARLREAVKVRYRSKKVIIPKAKG